MTSRAQKIDAALRVGCAVACILAAVLFLLIFVVLCVEGVRRHGFDARELGFPMALSIIGLLTFFSAYAAWRLGRGPVLSNGVTLMPTWFLKMFGWFILILLLVLVTGCTTTTRFVDVIQPSFSPHVVAMETTQTNVTFRITQDGITWLAGIRPRVIGGDVYLYTMHISSYVHQTVFTVDLSGPQFPQDWQQRLYWVEGESITSPLKPFANRVREIQRRKIQL